MNEIQQWTLADILNRVPLFYWWWVAGAIGVVFSTGWGAARWLQSRKLENAESELALELAKPKLTLALGIGEKDLGDVAHMFRYSFAGPEFIYPEIVQELQGWISDRLPVYASVDLEGAMKSNRFSVAMADEKWNTKGEEGWFWFEEKSKFNFERNPYFGYKFIGKTASGTHILHTALSGGGTGIFNSVLFMRFQTDSVMHDAKKNETRTRINLRCIGDYPLGDRYTGKVTYVDGILVIGPGTVIDLGLTKVSGSSIRVE